MNGGLATNLELLWMLVAHLVLTGLPAAAAVFLAMRRGLRSVPLLLAVALVASGGVAFLSFWLYYATPALGKAGAIVVVVGSVAAIAWCVRAGVERNVLRRLATPVALWALASAFVLFLGYFHGGTQEPLFSAQMRFTHPIASDNDVPRYFADYFYAQGHRGTPPPFYEWRSSDRPPLQIGYVLSQRPFGWDSVGLQYQVLGIVVQQLWILGLWALLCAVRLRPRTRGLAALAAIVSDVGILHAFFVWPKLIAAAFVLAALAMVLSDDWGRLRRQPLAGALFAALCGLAMLAHGSSVFFILPLLGLAAVRKMPNVAWIGAAAAVGIVLLGSWNAYQRYADPPGDQLLKWQLAGFGHFDDRPALKTIVDAYRDAGVVGTLDTKWNNVTAIIGRGVVQDVARQAADQVSAGQFTQAAGALRLPRYYSLLPFLGVLLIGPIAMLVARLRGGPRDGPDWRFAATAIGFLSVACVVWVVLLFGGSLSSTVIPHGSLALPVVAVCACVAAACAVSPRLGATLVAVNIAIVLVLYVPAVSPRPGTAYSALAGILAAISLAGVVWLTLRPGSVEAEAVQEGAPRASPEDSSARTEVRIGR